MKKQPGCGLAPFALLTAGLFLFTACYVVDDGDGRRCRSAGVSVGLVAAVDGRGGSGTGGGGAARNPGTGGGVNLRKPDQAPARPAPGGPVRKEPPRTTAPAVGQPVHEAPTAVPSTPTPTPSRTHPCKER